MIPQQKKILAGILAGGIAVLLLLALRPLFERTEEVVDRGYSGEAAVHPFFALKELFRSMGIPVRTVSSLRRLPPTDHALWVAAPARGTRPDRLVSWASGGGHLVVLPVGPLGEDPLLQALGVRRFGQGDADEDDHQSQPEFASDRPAWPLLYADEGAEILRSEGAPDAAWLLTVRIGDGAASVLASGDFLHNDAIGDKDHALIAWDAAILDQEPAGLWLVYRDPRPSVWVLMSSRAWPVVISLSVLMLAGLTFFVRRFGPLLEPSSRDRRQLAEHVRATGDFLWSVGCEDALLDAQREALSLRLGCGRRPTEARLIKRARRAAAAAGLDQEPVRRAVAVRTTRDRQEFTRAVHSLEELRRLL